MTYNMLYVVVSSAYAGLFYQKQKNARISNCIVPISTRPEMQLAHYGVKTFIPISRFYEDEFHEDKFS